MELRFQWEERGEKSSLEKYKKWPFRVNDISDEPWRMRKEESWSVRERGTISHCCLKHCNDVSSLGKKSKFLSVGYRCLYNQMPACLCLQPCLQSIFPAAWCFVPPCNCSYCTNGPEFLSQICFWVNCCWSWDSAQTAASSFLDRTDQILLCDPIIFGS